MKIKGKRMWIFLIPVLLILAVCLVQKPREAVPEYVLSYAENPEADYPTTLGGKYFA